MGQRQNLDLNPSLFGSSIISLIGEVLLSSDVPVCPMWREKRAVNIVQLLSRDFNSFWP